GVSWFVNGVAFAGDYLSAASFLGLCGMIAVYGYDGFLYSIGYLAGWVVALLVIAEPLKRMGKFTFADALDSQFQSRGVRLAAALSTLVVSLFYLIPQMVGAGVLVKPLLGLPHAAGVVLVGVVVILIVATAGMASTTYVQFLKGSLLILLTTGLTVMILQRGFKVYVPAAGPMTTDNLRPVGHVTKLPGGQSSTGPLGPLEFLSTLRESEVELWTAKTTAAGKVYEPRIVDGATILRPGNSPTFAGLKDDATTSKWNFLSLMLALFCGTASLPHILIRYYTVKDAAAARKSTVVGICTIGGFYVLTLFLGLGAMTGGAVDVTNSNMAAPMLAKTFGELPFALISAVAFTTVLGTVSGLIVAASGAVVHDLVTGVAGVTLADRTKVRIGQLAAVGVGAIAVVLGILFEKMNVNFLVGWAFSVAASANLPALVFILFWRRTTRQGVIASVLGGMTAALTWILLSGDTYRDVYGLSAERSLVPFSQPGIVTIPFSAVLLIVVSLCTRRERGGRDGDIGQGGVRQNV
ncbi:MAG: cation acetate symporter, partial [Gemmataceae bacterium]